METFLIFAIGVLVFGGITRQNYDKKIITEQKVAMEKLIIDNEALREKIKTKDYGWNHKPLVDEVEKKRLKSTSR